MSNVGKEMNTDLKREKQTINGLALVSFICSIVGTVVLRFPCGTVSILMGILAIVRFDEENEKGKWMAVVGLILGILEIGLVIYIICTNKQAFNVIL